MQADDIESAISVIESHDDEDAEEAAETYRANNGLEDQYVLEVNNEIIGVTGFATPPLCDGTHWLSWTYVHDDHCGIGHGRRMLEDLFTHLKSMNARKLFVKLSDYKEENENGDMESIYDAALHLYNAMGFETEVILRNYYDDGETMTILGLRLKPVDDSMPSMPIEKRKIEFNSIFEIAETDDSYSFGWSDTAKKMFGVDDVSLGVAEVVKQKGRAIFLSFPHNYADVDNTLYSAGFSNAGTLEDYFEDGVHEQISVTTYNKTTRTLS